MGKVSARSQDGGQPGRGLSPAEAASMCRPKPCDLCAVVRVGLGRGTDTRGELWWALFDDSGALDGPGPVPPLWAIDVSVYDRDLRRPSIPIRWRECS
jgi:hypothetical protein